jgi:hypothetical protein
MESGTEINKYARLKGSNQDYKSMITRLKSKKTLNRAEKFLLNTIMNTNNHSVVHNISPTFVP